MAICEDKDLEQENISHVFGHASRLVYNYVLNKLRPYGMGLEQLRILHYLVCADNDISIGELSAFLLKDMTTTSRLISSLENKGLVTKTKDSKDKRITHIRITKKGKDKIEELSFFSQDMDALFDNTLDSEELAALRNILIKIIKVVQ